MKIPFSIDSKFINCPSYSPKNIKPRPRSMEEVALRTWEGLYFYYNLPPVLRFVGNCVGYVPLRLTRSEMTISIIDDKRLNLRREKCDIIMKTNI